MASFARLSMTGAFVAAASREVKLTVIVSRHGIRTPYPPPSLEGDSGNLTAEAIARITDQPFPACWPAGPNTSDVWGTSGTAELTPHGSQSIKNIGVWHGEEDFSEVDCGDVALYADTASHRDNETAVSWAEGAFPRCTDLHNAEAIRDVFGDVALFNQGGDTSLCNFPGKAVIDTFIGGSDDGYESLRQANAARIARVDEIVQCCPDAACGNASNCTMSTMPIEYTGRFYSVTEGAVSQAAYWAEFFLLEYLNGHEQYALGKLNKAQILDLYHLAVENMEFMFNPVSSSSFASDLAVHIAASLQQAAVGRHAQGLFHEPSAKVVYMAAHDINLVLLRKLLGLYWQPRGWHANTVGPASMLIFELAEVDGEARVAAYFQMPTPEQARDNAPFTEDNNLKRIPVAIPGCSRGAALDCSVEDFVKVVTTSVQPKCIASDGLRAFIAGLTREASPEDVLV